MNFKFVKEDDNIKVSISNDEMDFDFDYIKMINLLYNKKTIEPSIFEGQFFQEEIDGINLFIKEMSEKIIANENVQNE